MARNDIHIHVHTDTADLSAITDQLDRMEAQLMTLQSSFDEMKAGAISDYQALADKLVAEQQAHIATQQELATALGNDAADQAEIDAANAKVAELEAAAAATQSDIDSVVTQMESFDLDTSNPAEVPPEPVDPNDLPHPDQTLPGDLPPQ